jgi:hypothetical protein
MEVSVQVNAPTILVQGKQSPEHLGVKVWGPKVGLDILERERQISYVPSILIILTVF